MLLVGSLAYSDDEMDCSKKLFDMQISEGTTINDILLQFSDKCQFSIVTKDVMAAKDLQKPLSGISIKQRTLRGVFDIILLQNNINYSYKDEILQLSSIFTKSFKIDYITSKRDATATVRSSVESTQSTGGEGSGSSSSDNEITSVESFDFWETIGQQIGSVLNSGAEDYKAPEPIVNPNAGLVTVTATKSQMDRVEKYIADLQKRLKRQVMLDVSIISVNLKNEYKTGIDWSKFELGFDSVLNAGYKDSKKKAVDSGGGYWTIDSNLKFNINGMMNFLEEAGNSKMISSPKVLTLHNQPALISVGANINYLLTTSSKTTGSTTETETSSEQYTTFVGILLNILPEISDDNRIMLRINPSLSDFLNQDDKLVGQRTIAPDTRESKLSTVAYVNDGDTVILGGLIEESKGKDNTNVPILSSIPLVGNLFKSTKDANSVTELVFVITPKIVHNSMPISESLRELGFSKSLYE
ncbi:pilus (MSHA type) biogenesis protein MshL [uncultured Campylobacter sp.]|uniref:pilus (MSHA type) biogenesis protein MshL n=1 Tax=uncultured Campylobacter sp. TaxID=218934 RepID=UPI00261C7740|nr:pilus (MSHA type) biogenesis protein MshL [uncultured Campylobacter sp.]